MEFLKKIYRRLYQLGEIHERYDIWLVTIEIFLIAYLFVPDDAVSHLLGPWVAHAHRIHHYAELCVFILLILLVLSRLAVRIRRHSLGYRYDRPGVAAGDFSIGRLYEQVSSTDWGVAPVPRPAPDGVLHTYADRIALHSATFLSVRTLKLVDEIWNQRERQQLGQWFESFPEGLWHLPRPGKTTPASQHPRQVPPGYYSVVVPITEDSRRAIRRGIKATDLAEIDPAAIDCFRNRKRASHMIRLLAYLQIYVPRSSSDNPQAPYLFTVSIQHIAFLLTGLFGTGRDFRRRWNFDLICESANGKMSKVLTGIGFMPVMQHAHEIAGSPLKEGESFAGFPLFEIKVIDGSPSAEMDNVKADAFLDMLEECVRTRGRPKKRPRK